MGCFFFRMSRLEMVSGPSDVEGQSRDDAVWQHPAGTGGRRADKYRHQITNNDDGRRIGLDAGRDGCEERGEVH